VAAESCEDELDRIDRCEKLDRYDDRSDSERDMAVHPSVKSTVLEMSANHTSAMVICGQTVKFWIWAVLKLMRQLDDVSGREKVTQKLNPVIEGRWN
jgi:hypothetical protein